ncbi:DDE-domain-containing protein, partial [Wolfiporia cocos MD-104 SS10]
IYSMDESGFTPSDQGCKKVIGHRGTKTQHKQGNGDHENITTLITIHTDGTVLKPTIVFNDTVCLLIAHSPNGWTDGKIALAWMKDDFDPQTQEKAVGNTCILSHVILLLDGHSSHYTRNLLKYAMENNIIVLGYPPHCTHALQGLDIVCFVQMKEEIRQFEELNKQGVHKADFVETFGKAFIHAFTEDSIHAAFVKTGIHPLNPNVITPEQMKLSAATSIKGEFPLPQLSPVHA